MDPLRPQIDILAECNYSKSVFFHLSLPQYPFASAFHEKPCIPRHFRVPSTISYGFQYISMDFFKQKIAKNEVGSSAMPHKVNPINFENAEGNLGIANAIFDHLSNKLPVSRLQRDLTDSTVLRNIGVPLGHSLIALKSLTKGVNKLLLNEAAISADLEDNWNVVAEAIQTILRRENYPDPYEKLKELTRTNEKVNAKLISDFIDALDVSSEVKEELRVITPWNYTGILKLKI